MEKNGGKVMVKGAVEMWERSVEGNWLIWLVNTRNVFEEK